MEQYFFKATDYPSFKNNLYKDFKAFALKNDGTLIKGEAGLTAFKDSFREHLKVLEEKHSRCKPIDFKISDGFGLGVVAIFSDNGSWMGYIYKVNNVLIGK